jgi:hypothetical protein
MYRLSSSTSPLGNTNTGTVPLGEAASIAAGLSRNTISYASKAMPVSIKAMRARIA